MLGPQLTNKPGRSAILWTCRVTKSKYPKGKVPRRAIKEVNAAPRGYPLYVRNHSRDGPSVAAVNGCGPSLSTSILIPVKIQTRPCQRLLRESSPNQFISQHRAN